MLGTKEGKTLFMVFLFVLAVQLYVNLLTKASVAAKNLQMLNACNYATAQLTSKLGSIRSFSEEG
jgi:hypothetical protein